MRGSAPARVQPINPPRGQSRSLGVPVSILPRKWELHSALDLKVPAVPHASVFPATRGDALTFCITRARIPPPTNSCRELAMRNRMQREKGLPKLNRYRVETLLKK